MIGSLLLTQFCDADNADKVGNIGDKDGQIIKHNS